MRVIKPLDFYRNKKYGTLTDNLEPADFPWSMDLVWLINGQCWEIIDREEWFDHYEKKPKYKYKIRRFEDGANWHEKTQEEMNDNMPNFKMANKSEYIKRGIKAFK